MPDKAESKRMRAREVQRAEEEAKLARKSEDDEERATHERRSDKAAYLADKLKQQEREPDDG